MLFGSSCDWLVAGLGNPGKEYEKSRHNMGFRAVELLARQLDCKLDRLKCKALTGQTRFAGQRLLLMKPQTYMNASGDAVAWAAHYFHVPPERIVVLSDDISLPVGKIRVRADGSAGGHNGLKSIIAQLGSQSFARIRIGVGEKPHPDFELADWVLSSFSAQEEKLLAPAIEHAAAAVQELVCAGFPAAASKFNGL